MTASSSNNIPEEFTEGNTAIISLDEELRNFKLQSFHSESFPNYINDLDNAAMPIQKAFGFVLDSALELERSKQHDEVEILRGCIPAIIELEHQINAQKTVLKDLEQHIRREPMNDIVGAYQKQMTRENAKWQLLSDKKKYKKHPFYTEFRNDVWAENHGDEPVPDSDDNDEDEDLVVGHIRQSTTCPITQTYLENPVTSRICKHTFSKHAIYELIRKNRGRIPCPNAGCGQTITTQILQDDFLAERRVARLRATEASQQQTQDFYNVE
ncbi:zinc-finger of the MIZ type in Nse subunit-domain-containing protein [Phascolomyces articulosus]|uniref:Zinc-finger of the MIZ type in Nse subunit-domain-containing protein n=1 Tax=Phascolomyces articulosus TaxID=60185 RepID=A0AAD5KFA9_9FUNG|nr:zinc-finger of the MIZ type in Nse subunit-domain-containing protein [Phascolomyces articulosus]